MTLPRLHCASRPQALVLPGAPAPHALGAQQPPPPPSVRSASASFAAPRAPHRLRRSSNLCDASALLPSALPSGDALAAAAHHSEPLGSGGDAWPDYDGDLALLQQHHERASADAARPRPPPLSAAARRQRSSLPATRSASPRAHGAGAASPSLASLLPVVALQPPLAIAATAPVPGGTSLGVAAAASGQLLPFISSGAMVLRAAATTTPAASFAAVVQRSRRVAPAAAGEAEAPPWPPGAGFAPSHSLGAAAHGHSLPSPPSSLGRPAAAAQRHLLGTFPTALPSAQHPERSSLPATLRGVGAAPQLPAAAATTAAVAVPGRGSLAALPTSMPMVAVLQQQRQHFERLVHGRALDAAAAAATAAASVAEAATARPPDPGGAGGAGWLDDSVGGAGAPFGLASTTASSPRLLGQRSQRRSARPRLSGEEEWASSRGPALAGTASARTHEEEEEEEPGSAAPSVFSAVDTWVADVARYDNLLMWSAK